MKFERIKMVLLTLFLTFFCSITTISANKLVPKDPATVQYSTNGDQQTADVPDWSNYNEQAVIDTLGKPESETTNSRVIAKALEKHEIAQLHLLVDQGVLTSNQATAFNMQVIDSEYACLAYNTQAVGAEDVCSELSMSKEEGPYIKKLSYAHDTVNVYLDTKKDKVVYVTPNKNFVEFN